MTGRKRFAELREKALADRPDRVQRVKQLKGAQLDSIKLAELRQHRRLSQQSVAGELGVTQARISQIEHEEDLYLSTLSGYVAALGGKLKMVAEFPGDEVIQLTDPKDR